MFLLPVVDLSLRFGGYARTRQRLQAVLKRAPVVPLPPSEARTWIAAVARGVSLGSRRTLWPTSCLRQALLVEFLLARRGIATELKIGVRPGEPGRLDAHAWVECEGRVLIGGEHARLQYTSLV